jgi:hypothetical protein
MKLLALSLPRASRFLNKPIDKISNVIYSEARIEGGFYGYNHV